MKDTNVPVESDGSAVTPGLKVTFTDQEGGEYELKGSKLSPMKSVPVEKLKKEFFDRFEHKYGSFLTEEQVKLRAYIWSEIETLLDQAIQAAKGEERKMIKDGVERLDAYLYYTPSGKFEKNTIGAFLYKSDVLSIINKHQ